MMQAYSEEEKRYIKANIKSMTHAEIAQGIKDLFQIERTPGAIKTQAGLMGLNRTNAGRGCMVDNERDNEYMRKVWREIHG
jgi:hypothetical protein